MGISLNAMKIHWQKTVGGVVGYSRLGRDYWRSLANHVHNPNTAAQQNQRAKISTLSRFMTGLSAVWRYGYNWQKGLGRSSYTCMFMQIYNDALTGDLQQGFTIDYSKILVSRGNLTVPYNLMAVFTPATHSATINWTDNTGVGNALATDSVSALIYNVSKQCSTLYNDIATRADETVEVTYPAEWAGDTAYIYIFLDNRQETTNSKAAGPYTA